MTTTCARAILTDRSAARLCPARWLDEADDVWWDTRFSLLLALLAPPGDLRRHAG